MENMSTQWSQQPSSYVFSKVIEFLGKTFENKSIRKANEYKTNKQSTKYSNWNIQIEI